MVNECTHVLVLDNSLWYGREGVSLEVGGVYSVSHDDYIEDWFGIDGTPFNANMGDLGGYLLPLDGDDEKSIFKAHLKYGVTYVKSSND